MYNNLVDRRNLNHNLAERLARVEAKFKLEKVEMEERRQQHGLLMKFHGLNEMLQPHLTRELEKRKAKRNAEGNGELD